MRVVSSEFLRASCMAVAVSASLRLISISRCCRWLIAVFSRLFSSTLLVVAPDWLARLLCTSASCVAQSEIQCMESKKTRIQASECGCLHAGSTICSDYLLVHPGLLVRLLRPVVLYSLLQVCDPRPCSSQRLFHTARRKFC
jgi:hypothetical protein